MEEGICDDTDYLLSYNPNNLSTHELEDSTFSLLQLSTDQILEVNEEKENKHKHENSDSFKKLDSKSLCDILDSKIIQVQSYLNGYLSKQEHEEIPETVIDNLNLNRTLLLTFSRIFDYYCYFIKKYEYDLYYSNSDKYINFITGFILSESSDSIMYEENIVSLRNIVSVFITKPSNIYMKLAWILYQKEQHIKQKALGMIKGKSAIVKNLSQLMDLWNEKTERNIFNVMIKKYNQVINNENKMNNFKTNGHCLKPLINMWSTKLMLNDNYINFGNDFVKERIIKKKLMRHMLIHGKNIQSSNEFYKTRLKKKTIKILKQKNLYFKLCNDRAEKFHHIDVKQNLMIAINGNLKKTEILHTQERLFLLASKFKFIYNLSEIINFADEHYFKSLKKKCMFKLTTDYKIRKYRYDHDLKSIENVLSLWTKKLDHINKLELKSHIQYSQQDLKKEKSLFIKRLRSRLELLDNMDTLRKDSEILLQRSAALKWLHKYRDVCENKKVLYLDSLLQQYLVYTDHSRLISRFVNIIKKRIGKLDSLQRKGAKFSDHRLKKDVVLKLSAEIGYKKDLSSMADTYRINKLGSTRLHQLLDNLVIVQDLNELLLVYQDRNTYKSIKRKMSHWIMKSNKVKNLDSILVTHTERWARAKKRGILGVWKIKINDLTMASENALGSWLKDGDDDSAPGINRNTFTPFESPTKSDYSKNEFLTYSGFKSMKIEERMQRYKNNTLGSQMRNSQNILKPSPIKRSQVLTKELKTKLDPASVDSTGSLWDYKDKNTLEKVMRNDIINKYRLRNQNVLSQGVHFVKKTADGKPEISQSTPMKKGNLKASFQDLSLSMERRKIGKIGQVPDLKNDY